MKAVERAASAADTAINQGMAWAFWAMILVVIGMFIAALFIRKTGKIA